MFTIPQWIKSISKHVSADGNIRPQLACVHVTNDGKLQATNSYIAVSFNVARTKSEKSLTADRYPDVGAKPIEEIPELGLSIPSGLIKTLSMKKNKTEIIDRRFILVDPCPDRGTQYYEDHLAIGFTDLERSHVIRNRKIKAQFPKIEHFIDGVLENPVDPATWIDVNYLLDTLQVFKDAGYDRVTLKPRVDGFVIE